MTAETKSSSIYEPPLSNTRGGGGAGRDEPALTVTHTSPAPNSHLDKSKTLVKLLFRQPSRVDHLIEKHRQYHLHKIMIGSNHNTTYRMGHSRTGQDRTGQDRTGKTDEDTKRQDKKQAARPQIERTKTPTSARQQHGKTSNMMERTCSRHTHMG